MAINFSVPAMEYQISLAYNKENPKIPANPAAIADIDVEGVTLAVMSGTAQDKAISAAITKATILRLPTNDETRLAQGSVAKNVSGLKSRDALGSAQRAESGCRR